MRKIFLESERLSFSNWTKNDYELAKELWGNDEVARFISANSHFTDEEIEKRLEKELENESRYNVQYWPIFLSGTKEFVGCCGLRPYDLEKNIYEIGVHILPQHWGKGIATEALKRVIEYAFKELKVDNLFAGHNPKNEASKKTLIKLGFKFFKEEYYEPTGLMHPSYLYKI